MKNVLYFAMTAAELQACPAPGFPLAWMACHFSPYGTGLSNAPPALPEGSLLIFNDRTPIFGHDPRQIAGELAQIMDSRKCGGLLLDLQRDGSEELVKAVADLPYPVAVTPAYGADLPIGIFLPPPPMLTPLADHLAPWQGREIWMEAALDKCSIRVDPGGSRPITPVPFSCPHTDTGLHCQYGMDIRREWVDFHLQRKETQLAALLEEAEKLGVRQFVGLYQQLESFSAQSLAQSTARFQR